MISNDFHILKRGPSFVGQVLANFKSNENPVFYWVHDVWCGGVLLRSLDGYGTVGTGLGAGTGAGTVQVRYGYGTGTIHGYSYGRYGTWVRFSYHVPYPCTVPTVPMYRTRTVPVPYLYRTRTHTRTQTRTNRPVPSIWHTVLLPKWPIENYSPN